MRRSRSSVSWSSSSRPARRSRSSSRGRARSRLRARPSARRIRLTRIRARCAASSRSRCRTTSCTARIHRSRPSARSRSGSPMGWSEDAAKNRALWTQANADFTDRSALASWRDEPRWGVWRRPDAELGILGDVAGLDVVELGCGTAYVSAWLARAGARPTGVDITPAQLETARRCMRETGIQFELVEADAGATGLPDASADLVVSEYGASIWVDPYRWVPEAARLLRPGGRLVFMCNSVLVILCSADDEAVGEALERPQKGMHRF